MSEKREPMEYPPLPRHPALQPLSREHFGGLVLARDLGRCAQEGPGAGRRRELLRRFAAAWDEELGPHFADEERLLGPHIGDEGQLRRLIAEHRALERMAAEAAELTATGGPLPGAWWFAEAGRLLHDHIRWEERVLFPAVESTLSEEAAAAIARETAAAEEHRPGARRRCDLHRGPGRAEPPGR